MHFPVTKKINPKYIAIGRPSIFKLCVIWLMLDRLEASAAVCAVFWTLAAISFVFCMALFVHQDLVHPKDL